jgi:hypothetical protein
MSRIGGFLRRGSKPRRRRAGSFKRSSAAFNTAAADPPNFQEAGKSEQTSEQAEIAARSRTAKDRGVQVEELRL